MYRYLGAPLTQNPIDPKKRAPIDPMAPTDPKKNGPRVFRIIRIGARFFWVTLVCPAELGYRYLFILKQMIVFSYTSVVIVLILRQTQMSSSLLRADNILLSQISAQVPTCIYSHTRFRDRKIIILYKLEKNRRIPSNNNSPIAASGYTRHVMAAWITQFLSKEHG